MFLMPYLRQVIRGAFPIGVILLVAANLLVFFGFQQRDEARYGNAFDYYEHSILLRIEPKAYQGYLEQRGPERRRLRFEKAMQRKDLSGVIHFIEKDGNFMRALRAGEIVRPDHPDYQQWREARRYFDSAMGSIVVQRYAFDTDRPSLLTAFSHQFLHGGLEHLAGNMVVLILIAPAVEALLGTPLFLLIYLVGGLGAVGMHWLIAGSGSLVGASGAISAAMGAFAVLLRWRRIPFFYFVIVYFDIVRAPALLALPIWLANEALQLFWLGNSHVAYGAHIGGLVTGALLAWPFIRRAEARLQPEAGESLQSRPADTDKLPGYLAEARRLMREHRFNEARRAYLQVAAHAGGDLDAWRECLNVIKLSPASDEYHRAMRHLLKKGSEDAATHRLVLEGFREYMRLAEPRPNLDAGRLLGLAERFRRHGCVPELERVARLLHVVAPEHPRCREILLAAASGHYGAGDAPRAAELTRLAESIPA